ncbi:ABC transporter ATP-binding protein [Bacillus sp. SM2101]|uniref:ABC transporter ATP-binding protein n=1 Tax=Bacillus sp. SM2101 TaxID=2805366 RepID=UPI001BDE8B63
MNRATISRLYNYLLLYKHHFLATTVVLILAIGADLLVPYVIKHILDNYVEGGLQIGLFTPVYGLLALILIAGFLNFSHEYLFSKYTINLVEKIRNDLVQYINMLPKSFFDKTPTGEIINKITNESMQIKDAFDNFLGGFVVSLLQLIGIYIILILINPYYALISLIIPGILLTVNYIINRPIQRYISIIQEYLNKLNILFVDIVKNFLLIRLNGVENQLNNEYKTYNDTIYKNMIKRMHILHISDVNFNGLFRGVLIAFTILYFGEGIIEGEYSVGVLYLLIEYTRRIFLIFRGINSQWVNSLTSIEAANRVFSVYENYQPETRPTLTKKIREGKITFKQVNFSYDNNREALKDISLTINPGEKVAIVGQTGSGKSTIVNLLLGFYTPKEGNILVDDTIITNLDMNYLRDQISYVDQHSYEFDMVYLNELNHTQKEKLKETLHRLGSTNLIDKINQKNQSKIEELSSGEKQLITIALALLKESKLIILDEATSSQDVETERKVFEILAQESKNKTLIMISHRLSTVRNANKIFVMGGGMLKEKGNHLELMNKQGFYYKLTTKETSRVNTIEK